MSAPTPEQAAAPAPEQEGNPPAEAQTQEPADLGDAGKRAIDRMKAERDEARRVQAETAARLKAIEERDLSELDRAKKQATDAAAELAELRRQNVLLSKGISADLTPPPAAAPPDAWADYADRLLAWKGTGAAASAPAAATAPPTPKPDMSQGAQPADDSAAATAAYERIAAQNWGHLTNPTRK